MLVETISDCICCAVIDTCHQTLGDLGCMALIVEGVEFVPIQVKGMSEQVIRVNLGSTITISMAVHIVQNEGFAVKMDF